MSVWPVGDPSKFVGLVFDLIADPNPYFTNADQWQPILYCGFLGGGRGLYCQTQNDNLNRQHYADTRFNAVGRIMFTLRNAKDKSMIISSANHRA